VIVLSKNLDYIGLSKAYSQLIVPAIKVANEKGDVESEARLIYAAQRITNEL
jgi:hypothetical protein